MSYLLDVNVLIDSVHTASKRHGQVVNWLDDALAGPPRTVALPWHTVLGFVRITTNAKVFDPPVSVTQAWSRVTAWLDQPAAWIPAPTDSHQERFGTFVDEFTLTSALVSDAHLAALAAEHGLVVVSADQGFARFANAGLVRWLDPAG